MLKTMPERYHDSSFRSVISLQGDPRFVALLRKVNFTQEDNGLHGPGKMWAVPQVCRDFSQEFWRGLLK